ncbi:trifunctional serine/threonine-protein kinase/ATP-binding protein/sensor histidine kinase [Rhizobium tubonense]|uniref:trifunctional serine/threonine-protein kinase/ATP-binding protein/sensor histidine kinase n=1 Tax=Rhizobium tubonense TaxID=484088 RepID=UPI0018A83448|nr:AAA family ATPase [Rhizobium tubonense]
MAEPADYELETLREETEFAWYRGRSSGDQARILAVAPVAEKPSPRTLQILEHEYSLAADLDAAWAAKPLALRLHQERPILIFEDPGGEPLNRLIAQHHGKPTERANVLRIAIGLTSALAAAHGSGLIHRDIKPSAFLVDKSGRAWLTSFGIASRMRRERMMALPTEIMAGTFAYMSPEQTGRMNRSVDARSDLYSLGVVLYELLTGVLPFSAVDPLEWVHSHIARQPVPPAQRRAVPAPLSAIVIKLLAKNAEERYQTAVGLEADLRRCLSDWQSKGRIDPFVLGADDTSDKLLIPEKLYGRESDVDALIAAFGRVVEHGVPEVVLVSGYSGVGKSSVVSELHRALVPSRGIFAAGKFDQYKRDIPYATLAEALQTLVRQILVKGEAEVDQWRRDIVEAVGPNGQLIVNLVPELEFVIGKQPPAVEVGAQETMARFQSVFVRFLGVFARPEHPLALFLDDLQWLDMASLDLLERLATEPDMRHLLLIGAYRSNEVSPSHTLMRTFARMRDGGAKIENILLAPLGIHDVEQLTADALDGDRSSAHPLALLIHEKTGGNPFFAIQLLTSLTDEGLLRFDREAAGWGFDLNEIRAKAYSNNVVDLMLSKLRRLSSQTQIALQQFACLGNVAEVGLLSAALGLSEGNIHDALLEAAHAGLIVRLEQKYAFLHDRIQEAAYALIADNERAAVHLRIGRLLLLNLTTDNLAEHIFEVARQLNGGAELLVDDDEKTRVAAIDLQAARRAKASAAYASALTYLVAGSNLLGDRDRESRRELGFALEVERAGCELLTGDLTAAEHRLTALSGRAANLVDMAAVTCLRVDLYAVLSQSDRAVAVCLDYLRKVGVEWSPHPTDLEVKQEYEQIWQRIGSRPIEDLIDLPIIQDASTRATMDVLTKVQPSTQNIDDKLLCLITMRMVNLSLEYGNCSGSSCAYVFFGMILSSYFENYPAARSFGRLSLDLVGKPGLDAFKARVYQAFAIYVSPWAEHVRSTRVFVKQAFDLASRAGDVTYAAYCRDNLVTNSLACGELLGEVEKEATEGIEFASKAGFGLIVDIIKGQRHLVRTLSGAIHNSFPVAGAELDERELEERLEADPNLAIAACWYWIRRIQSRVFMQDYPAAVAAADKAQTLLWTTPAHFEKAEYHFYAALARAGSIVCGLDHQSADMKALVAHHRQIQIWAEHCPENFENRSSLIAAEIARIEGREQDAARHYDAAIKSARKNGFIHNEALANELLARFYSECSLDTSSNAHLRNAYTCYHRWGAYGKTKQLEERHPGLREERASITTAAIDPWMGELDVAAVVKAAQALSSEIVLPKLIERLMHIALEHAGAERGLLILIREGEPRIEAEATAGSGAIEVVARNSAVITSSDLPQSILHYVVRTQERVLLDDGSSANQYFKDEYLRLKRCRSVLCLPIVRKKRLVAALYLENNLSPGIFTPDRVAVLGLLVSQASISLENAAVYNELQSKVRLLHLLPVSAWTLGPDGTPDFVNQVWLDFSGQTLEFVRTHPEAWMTAIHPDDREIAARSFYEGVSQGQGFAFETRSLRATDGTYRWHLQQAVVLRDAEGKVLKFIGTTTDIDDQKRAQKRAEETLRQTQGDLAHVGRIATLNAMTASIAHEVSQPLSGILTNAGTCLRMLAADSPSLTVIGGAVRRTIRDAERANEIVRRLRAMFSAKAPAMENVDLNDAAKEVITLSAREVKNGGAVVQTKFADGLPPISADRVQLQQVILNLLLNAVDAMANVEDRPRTVVVETSLQGSGGIKLTVRDSGTGVDAKTVEKLFQAFYTTKANGMGVGLSICRSIIESHGGRLMATANEDGPGATFAFDLPSLIDLV